MTALSVWADGGEPDAVTRAAALALADAGVHLGSLAAACSMARSLRTSSHHGGSNSDWGL